MKYTGVFFAVFFFCGLLLFAQEEEDVKLWTLYPGYVVTHDDDTIRGFVKLNNYISNQKKALFFAGKYDEEPIKTYNPKKIKVYRVGPRVYESFKFKAVDATPRHHFFLRKIEGPISLYEWYFEPTGLFSEQRKVKKDKLWADEVDFEFNEEDLGKELIMIKLEDEPESVTDLKYVSAFNKNMSKFVEDNEELAGKILNNEKGYRIEDLERIIREYNVWYLSNNK